ncbi:MAG: NAD(P)-dependent alcohol dehydrogenase [Nitrospirota bacterium]|jgi:uncharacterized zinc-type alcohol dehydrogenase-like protein
MSRQIVHAYAAAEAKSELTPFEYELGDIGADQVDVAVEYCGICHSDLSMLDNEWGMSTYPLVPGHEVVGTVVRVGSHVQGITEGDRVGVGWFSGSCMHCPMCLSGHHHLCSAAESTIVGRYGGFADMVRCHWVWTTPLPEGVDAAKAGPLFCGGITVFSPILKAGLQPTGRAGVIGIGGLGHLALQFLSKWGCEVTAFTSSPEKADEARQLGAHHVVNSRDEAAMNEIAGSLDLILNTTNVSLNWPAYLQVLAPRGILHTVGAVLEPMAIPAMPLMIGEKAVSGSPLGSPFVTRQMLEFCARHEIQAVTEQYALNDVNAAIEYLRAGKARYRIVLKV